MKAQHTFFAVDLGATSGRTIIGTLADRNVSLEECTRFENPIIYANGHYHWDIYALYHQIIIALQKVAREGIAIESIGIDTWGVDFVFVGCDGGLMRNPIAYRDPYTDTAMPEYFAHRMPREKVYAKTGIQFMPFNSLFQLYAMQQEHYSPLEACETLLFVPDALSYMLTGKKVTEYTIASTSQMLDAEGRTFDPELLSSVGLTPAQCAPMVQPGTVIGTLTPQLQALTGLGALPVVAVAGHDTASAVAAVPATTPNFAYLSSGTWSLMGIERPAPDTSDTSLQYNFTNEGGIDGTIRYLKNICGLWLYERCRTEWHTTESHSALIAAAAQEPAKRSIINPDAPSLANPPKMVEAIQAECQKANQPIPETPAALCRCIFDSLAHRYQEVFAFLQQQSAQPLEVLHIIGGGSQNAFLNQLTANAIGTPVLAGPAECTALGNVMLQARALGTVSDRHEMRRIIAQSVETVRFEPQK